MKIENPKVTLKDEARNGVQEEGRNGFLDWLFEFNVHGDDGKFYMLGGSILSLALEKMDLVALNFSKGKGHIRQLKNSIYKLAEYPGSVFELFYRNPQETLKIEKADEKVTITCGTNYKVECFENGIWHLEVNSPEEDFSAELFHTPHGFPLWYGREKPSCLTQHSITYGYNWAGDVHGYFLYIRKKD